MQLIIHDRRPLDVAPTGEPLLTIEHKGTFSLSIAAVAALGLRPTDELVLAQDGHTNAWYLIAEPTSDMEAFELRPRDKSSRALMFCCQHRARAYYQAHGLSQQKSVRSLVGATAVEHDGLKLYPLTPQHPTTTPAAAPAPVVEPSAPAEPAAIEQPAPTVAPVSAEAETHLEQLTDKWYEADITSIEEPELTELIDGLGAKGKNERDIVENAVLNRAKTERARRAKKGGRRG